jgi:hypothetical protein
VFALDLTLKERLLPPLLSPLLHAGDDRLQPHPHAQAARMGRRVMPGGRAQRRPDPWHRQSSRSHAVKKTPAGHRG